jgi:PAS domain S-box-containing protein
MLGAAALVLIQPAVWGVPYPTVWFPAAGIAFAFVAWFGRRAALLPLLAGLSTSLALALTGSDAPTVIGASADGAIAALEALLGCRLYVVIARGGRRLSDPRSAVEFLLLVPGITAAAGALGRAAVAANGLMPTTSNLTALWLAHALGLLAVAPPLLVCLTPWLVRRGLTVDDAPDAAPLLPGPVGADRVAFGDAVEIGGLALCAGGLGLLLALAPGHRLLAGWQVWGAPMLLIVWASLRQGLQGGTTVACAAVAVPLAMAVFRPIAAPVALLLQGNLLAQASTGLLVAASASWLRASEHRYRQLVAHVPVVVYSVRITGNPPAAEVSLVSAASADLLGCPPDQFLGDHGLWLAHVHPQDREVLLAAITQLDRQPGAVTCEYRFSPAVPDDWNAIGDPPAPRSRSAGHGGPRTPGIRWVRDTLAPQRDDEGKLTGWEGVVTDVTEQRTLADDLRRASSMLHALVNNLPAGVFFVQGAHGQPILVNARARQLLGQREDATLDHIASTYRLHRPDGSRYPVEELPVTRALRDGRTTMSDDVVAHRPDGRRVPLVTWGAPVELAGPESKAAVWVLQDLTALHQAEAARRDSENRLRVVVETMGEALTVLDRKGEIVEANPAAAGLFGAELAAILGRALSDLGWTCLREDGSALPDEEHPANVALRTGRPVRGAVLGLLRVGAAIAVRWVHVNAMPLGSPAAGVVTTFSDITRYRQHRDGILASEERYPTVVDSLSVPFLHMDTGFYVTYCNPAVQIITGYEREDIATPKLLAAKVRSEDLSTLRSDAGTALTGRPVRGLCRYRAKDGTNRVTGLLLEPRLERGEIVGITALLVDPPSTTG